MRVGFSRARRIVADWNDNKKLPEDKQLAFLYTPLEYGEFTEARDIMRRIMVSMKNEQGNIDSETEEGKALFDLLKRLLPAKVKSVGAPLLPDHGDDRPVTVEEIAVMQPFIYLAMEMLASLISVSAPTEADLKN